jgi:hypothetical protein
MAKNSPPSEKKVKGLIRNKNHKNKIGHFGSPMDSGVKFTQQTCVALANPMMKHRHLSYLSMDLLLFGYGYWKCMCVDS